jgi:ABC-type branched-subunit amino acid transport system ATPase component
MNEHLLVLDSLKKRFGDMVALRGISATVSRGTITAFVGPNGAGKTTLFHTISGNLSLDSGKILYRQKLIGGLAPWRIARLGIGKLFQDVRIFESLTVLENVLLAMHDHPGQSAVNSLLRWPAGWKAAAWQCREAETWLDEAGVERPFDRPAGLLSFGNKKLLALARLMAGGFELLLLDEPAAGLGPLMVDRIGELLKMLVRERGRTIALIEHNISFVRELADRTYVLRAGEIFDHGATNEVLGKEENRELLIGL